MIPFILLFILFNILNWLDYYLIRCSLKLGGKELNFVIRAVGLLPAKIGATILFGLAGYFINYTILIPASIIMAGACTWNYYIWQSIKINPELD